MSDLGDVRRRGGGSGVGPSQNDPSIAKKEADQDSDDVMLTDEQDMGKLTKNLAQASDETVSVLDKVLSTLPPRWRNWIVRGIFSWVMIFGFGFLVYMGPIALMILILLIQLKCYKEIIDIGHAVYRVHDLPWFRSLSWYLLICSNYYFCGESLIENWGIVLRKDEFLSFLVKHHRFISFLLYCGGFIWFVLSLKKGYYMRQFSVFAYTHVALFLLVLGSYCMSQNILQGLIWFLAPVSMIICNDIMAYMFGFFFGKTSLIELSPKKTWEGFIGGAVSTVIFAFVVIRLEPFIGHAVILSLFASLVGPFGGFFASGFKRAFKIKDFGDVIPGHGGLMDRFDCQVIMGAFVWVYIQTFIRIPSPAKIVQQILFLQPDEQMEVYRILTEQLILGGLLPNQTIDHATTHET